LLQQGLGRKHQDRATIRIIQRHQQGSHCQLDGFAQAYLVGQYKPCPTEAMPL
jgi:hypothetical protein